jgi:DNA invertase Pin-like site-specific DNA recombinase
LNVALIYVRQSRHRDYKRTVSPQVQEEGCRSLPAVQACDKVEVFIDLDKSGKTTAGRKEFQAFLKRLENNPPDVVAVYDQSRSFRSVPEALQFRALMVERLAQVAVAVVHGSFDRTVVGKFSYTSLAAAHEMERDMVAEKMRDTYRYLAGQGEMVGAVPPGYMRDTDTGVATINEEEASVIRRVFDEYATGRVSVRDLARKLNAEGVALPTIKEWKGDTVAQIIGNVAYIGKTYTGSRRRAQGNMIDGKWPAIIERATWDAVQRQRRLRGPGGRKPDSGSPPRQYVFQRLLRHSCGRKMHAQTTKGVAYYRCPDNGQEEPCRALIREDLLIRWGDGLMLRLDRLQPADFGAAVASLTVETHRPPDALAQVEATIARLGKRFDWGHVTETEYLAEHGRLQALREEIKAARVAEPTVRLDGVLDTWETGDPQVRRELLGELFDELDVRDGEIVGCKPRSDREAEVSALLDLAYSDGPGGQRAAVVHADGGAQRRPAARSGAEARRADGEHQLRCGGQLVPIATAGQPRRWEARGHVADHGRSPSLLNVGPEPSRPTRTRFRIRSVPIAV